MPCDAIATARAQIGADVAIPAAILKTLLEAVLKREFDMYDGEPNVYLDARFSTSRLSLSITYNKVTGNVAIRTEDDSQRDLVLDTMRRASAMIAVKALAGRAKIKSSRRTESATILKVRI